MHADELNRLTHSLAAEFPAFEFTTQQTSRGRSLVAERRPGKPGALYVVITSDPGEMRRMLTTAATSGPRERGKGLRG